MKETCGSGGRSGVAFAVSGACGVVAADAEPDGAEDVAGADCCCAGGVAPPAHAATAVRTAAAMCGRALDIAPS